MNMINYKLWSLIMKMDEFYYILRWIFDYMFWVHVGHMELPCSYAHLLHFRFFLGYSDGLKSTKRRVLFLSIHN